MNEWSFGFLKDRKENPGVNEKRLSSIVDHPERDTRCRRSCIPDSETLTARKLSGLDDKVRLDGAGVVRPLRGRRPTAPPAGIAALIGSRYG